MTRVNAYNYSQLLGSGLDQLALMLRGSGIMDQGYAGSWGGQANTNQPMAANSQRPAYEHSWAALADNSGPFGPGNHLPITKAQEILIAPSQPYIDTIPWRPYAPEYIPIPPRLLPFPPDTLPLPPRVTPFPIPENIPIPFTEPSQLKGKDKAPSKRECDKEWAEAAQICNEKQARLWARGISKEIDMGNCMRDLVSEACGGRPVQYGKKPPPPVSA
jgi:hypothetical protein